MVGLRFSGCGAAFRIGPKRRNIHLSTSLPLLDPEKENGKALRAGYNEIEV
jgi:hypothetical protein